MDSRLSHRAVVLSTDCGTEMDDQWALTHLALSPEIDLHGVVTTHAPNLAPPAAETSARAARQVLANLPLTHCPPVVAGASTPLHNRTTPHHNAGVEFLLDAVRGFSGENRLAVLVIGAATDVASALLIDPGLADRIEVVAMGFQGLETGGDEWNVKNDVRAWQVLLDAGLNIAIGDAAVCKRHLWMTHEHACAMLAPCGEAGRYLSNLLRDWLRVQPDLAERVTGRRDVWPIWDQVTVAHLLGLTTGQRLTHLILGDDLTLTYETGAAESGRVLQWITDVDAPALWGDLIQKLRHVRA